MSDIVDRLSEFCECDETRHCVPCRAADEIERLRTALAAADKDYNEQFQELMESDRRFNSAADEIERLRARIAGGVASLCCVCEEPSPREGCDCVCCTKVRGERALARLAEAERLLERAINAVPWWDDEIGEGAAALANEIETFREGKGESHE